MTNTPVERDTLYARRQAQSLATADLRLQCRRGQRDLHVALRELDDSQDATIEAALDFTPTERLEQLESWTDFVLTARANLG